MRSEDYKMLMKKYLYFVMILFGVILFIGCISKTTQRKMYDAVDALETGRPIHPFKINTTLEEIQTDSINECRVNVTIMAINTGNKTSSITLKCISLGKNYESTKPNYPAFMNVKPGEKQEHKLQIVFSPKCPEELRIECYRFV